MSFIEDFFEAKTDKKRMEILKGRDLSLDEIQKLINNPKFYSRRRKFTIGDTKVMIINLGKSFDLESTDYLLSEFYNIDSLLELREKGTFDEDLELEWFEMMLYTSRPWTSSALKHNRLSKYGFDINKRKTHKAIIWYLNNQAQYTDIDNQGYLELFNILFKYYDIDELLELDITKKFLKKLIPTIELTTMKYVKILSYIKDIKNYDYDRWLRIREYLDESILEQLFVLTNDTEFLVGTTLEDFLL